MTGAGAVARSRRGRGGVDEPERPAATASPPPSPSVSVTSSRANPAENVLGTCELPRLVTSARPPATNRKMVATSTSGTADSAPLRQIQPEAEQPEGDAGQRVGALAELGAERRGRRVPQPDHVHDLGER